MAKLIRFDWAIKNLLRNEANFDILEGFLSELLKTQVTIETLLESESNKSDQDDKSNRVDLLVLTENQGHVIIEVQADMEWDYLSRVLYGTSKAVTEYIQAGQPYRTVRKIISVSILFFNLGRGADYVYHGTTEFRGTHQHDLLQLGDNEAKAYGPDKTPSDIFPEYYLIKVDQFNNRIKDKFDEWMYFLKTEKIQSTFSAQGLKSAAKKLDILALSEKERKAYERYEENSHYEASMHESHYGRGKLDGEMIGEARGEVRGEVRGEIQTKVQVLLLLLKQKLTVVPEKLHKKILSADSEMLQIWIERVHTSTCIEAVFNTV